MQEMARHHSSPRLPLVQNPFPRKLDFFPLPFQSPGKIEPRIPGIGVLHYSGAGLRPPMCGTLNLPPKRTDEIGTADPAMDRRTPPLSRRIPDPDTRPQKLSATHNEPTTR